MKVIKQEFLTGERALFQGKDLKICDTTFADGESPLKESRNIELYGSMFKWKYPLWYSRDIKPRVGYPSHPRNHAERRGDAVEL